MRLCRIDELTGGEILARAVMTGEYQILLAAKTKLRPEYIEKLKDLDIQEVYVDDPINTETVAILKEDVEQTYKTKVKTILEKHTYSHNEELVELSKTADNIIGNILEEEEVVEKIFDIKERSSDIYEHSISICSLATLLALKLKLSQERVHDIGVACLLHDLGLRYLTISYNNQDLGELSELEVAEYRKHPVYGYSSLRDEKWISETSKNIILYHHERLDGSGYPLKATNIPTESKIVTICEAFDEMICGIGCKRSKVYEAVEYLKNFKNIKFDGTIVDIFLEFTAVYPAGSFVLTNEGEIAVVLRQNKQFPDRPVLKIVRDKNGREIEGGEIKDMLHVNYLFIEKVIE